MTGSVLTRRPLLTTAGAALVGFVGAILVARASYVVGTLPRPHLDRTVATGPYRWWYEAGVALMLLAWLALGRLAFDPAVTGMTRRLWWAAAAWTLPLLVAAPVTSQDVWAYLGQANVAAHGLDPYSVGPGAVPGPYSHAVAHEWLHAPSPYGPLWMWLCRLVVTVTSPHPWAGMFVLRAIAVAGLVTLGVGLARLTRVAGGRPEVALWLAVAAPFPLLMLVGGVHNDAVMLALLVGGVCEAATSTSLRRAVLLGAVLVGAAAAIKVVALVALPFLPLVWARYSGGPGPTPTPAESAQKYVEDTPSPHTTTRRRRGDAELPLRSWMLGGVAASVVGLSVLVLTGLVTGFGLGWVPQVGDGRIGVRWLSVPQQVGNLLHIAAPHRVADLPVDRYPLVHPIGLAFLALALAAVLVTARRRPPVRSLTLATLAVVVSSPAPRTWYLLWPLVFLAADRLAPWLTVATTAASATVVLWFPASVRPQPPEWLLLALLAGLAVVASVVVRPHAPVARTEQATVP